MFGCSWLDSRIFCKRVIWMLLVFLLIGSRKTLSNYECELRDTRLVFLVNVGCELWELRWLKSKHASLPSRRVVSRVRSRNMFFSWLTALLRVCCSPGWLRFLSSVFPHWFIRLEELKCWVVLSFFQKLIDRISVGVILSRALSFTQTHTLNFGFKYFILQLDYFRMSHEIWRRSGLKIWGGDSSFQLSSSSCSLWYTPSKSTFKY